MHSLKLAGSVHCQSMQDCYIDGDKLSALLSPARVWLMLVPHSCITAEQRASTSFCFITGQLVAVCCPRSCSY